MTTKTPVEELMHEHQHILKVVNALKALGEQVERDNPVDVELLRGAGRFLREFADVCHHGKEEAVLFPAMERRGVPESGCPLGALRSEHKKGRKLVSSFRDSVEAYAADRGDAREELVANIAAICQFYPDHIWKEDDMVFPMVDRLFEPRDLEQLRLDFDKAEEELGENHDWYVAFADRIAEAATNLIR
jgi:hemerythrin-like domain-containing protein